MARDILTNAEGDVIIANDLVMGDGDKQNLERMLQLTTGSLRFAPLVGPNAFRLLNSKVTTQDVVRDIKLNLEVDNWSDIEIRIEGKNIDVDAVRK